MGDEAYRAALREAISAVAREHLVDASRLGEVSRFVLSFHWQDVTGAHGEHLLVDGQEARAAVRGLNELVFTTGHRAAGLGPAGRNGPPVHHRRRRTD